MRDGRGTDGRTDGRTEWNQYTPPTTSLCEGGGGGGGGIINDAGILQILFTVLPKKHAHSSNFNSSHPSVNWVSIGSDNGLSPIRHQAIIWTSAELLLIKPLGTNFNEILIKIQNFSFAKMDLKDRLRNGGHFVQGVLS